MPGKKGGVGWGGLRDDGETGRGSWGRRKIDRGRPVQVDKVELPVYSGRPRNVIWGSGREDTEIELF